MVMLIPQLSRYIKPIVIFLVAIAVVMSLTTATSAATASVPLEVTVYRDPFCSCCEGWIDYLTNQGFQPTSVKTSTIDTLKQQYGVPDDLASCHTAVINGYVVEGHVPADDIKRLLAEQPNDVAGISALYLFQKVRLKLLRKLRCKSVFETKYLLCWLMAFKEQKDGERVTLSLFI